MQENEHEPEQKSTPPGNLAILETIDHVKEATPRQTMTMALIIGVCFVFIAAMFGAQHFDDPLNNALNAFSLAIPLLAFGLGLSFYRSKQTVRGWRILEAILVSAWAIEGIGVVVATVGFYFILLHFSLRASLIFLITSLSVGVICLILALIGLFVWAWVHFKHEEKEKKKQTPPAPAP